MIIIQTTDFTGYQAIAVSIKNTALLQTYINRLEKLYIYKLLSNNVPAYPTGLAQQFITDAQAHAGVPIIPRFLKIFDELFEQDGSRMRTSKGMKDILVSLIFYHFVTDTDARHTQSGIATPAIDAASKAGYENAVRFAEKRWNEALTSIESIKWWLKTGNANGGGNADYPEYIDDSNSYIDVLDGTGGGAFTPKFSSIL